MFAQAQSPRLFFSDLDSGPNTGGENNSGVYVTLYGTNLGTTPVVTVGGGQAVVKLAPMTWLWYQKMVIQLGPAAQTGQIVVTNASGASNGLAFTVRPGNIYFVATGGNDSATGAFGSPWASVPKAVQRTGAGDTIYLMDGVAQTTDDGQGWNAALTLRAGWCQGTASAPKALLAYPGATATIGTTGATPVSGLRVTDFTASGGACGGNWTIAGLNFRGISPISTNGPSTNWRIIGNDISNPQNPGGGGGGAAMEASLSTYVKWYGNNGHDLNLSTSDNLQQGFYLSTDSNHADIGWNGIQNTKGRAGMQVHSSPVAAGTGYAMYDIAVHDNVIHDTAEEGMIIDTVDPSQGPVRIYNNIVYNVGLDGHSNGAIYRAVSSDFDTTHGMGSGTVEIYNNTIFGYRAGYGFGATYEVHRDQPIVNRLRNNIIFSSNGLPYIYEQTASSSNYTTCGTLDTPLQCPVLAGSNNLMFGAGTPAFPNLLTGSINQDPKLVSATDAHLQSASPAIDTGVAITGFVTDISGSTRPQGLAYDLGAYEFAGTGTGTGTGAGSGATAPSISLTLNPSSVSLQQGQSQQFTATVTGTTNTGVTWSVNPAVGQLTTGGLYLAPASITTAQTLTITATSIADTTKSVTGSIFLQPSAGPVTVALTLGPGGTAQFTSGSGGAVSWSMTPAIGALNTSGLYTAPSTITSAQTVSITATLTLDSSKSAVASILLMPPVPVSVQVSPTAVTLLAGQSQQFAAAVGGTTNTGVVWSLSPAVGQLSSTGLYVAPATITSSQTVVVTAKSVADGTKLASASVNLAAVAVSVNPSTASLGASGTTQFMATVSGTSNTGVTWSMSPAVGTLSASGFYKAPASISSKQTVTVKATSAADPTKSASAVVTLSPGQSAPATAGVSWTVVNGTSLQVNWTAINGGSSGSISLTSPGAPDWWSLASNNISGSSGQYTLPLPAGVGQYELRMYLSGGVTARSTVLAQNVSGFSLVPDRTTVAPGGTISLTFTAPAGRPGGWSGDVISLCPVSGCDQAAAWAYPLGAAGGTMSFIAPQTAGTYTFFYETANSGYVSAAQTAAIVVQ